MNTVNADVCDDLHRCLNGLPMFSFPYAETKIPQNGIYLLFEDGECAHGVGRVVRVGTHTGADQLRSRLKQHFVNEVKDRSIFRKNIGRCLLARDKDPFIDSWELDLTSRLARDEYEGTVDFEKQASIEQLVSQYIRRNFRFAVLEVLTKAERLDLESKLISTVYKCDQCRPSPEWLGRHSPKRKIRSGGLWQVNKLNGTPISVHELQELRRALGVSVGS